MTESKKPTSIYTGIDVFKLIASILIILLHVTETTNYYAVEIKEIFTRFAVPFFFIASGFFFHKGLERSCDKSEYFKKYIKNILFLFLIWALLIYSPFVIHSYITQNPYESTLKIILMLFRRIFVIGPGAYWYLIALLCSACFLYFCHIKKSYKLIVFAIILGFLLQFAYVCFKGVLSQITLFSLLFKGIYFVYSWEFNFIMYGIPFMGLGYFISKKDITLKPLTSAIILIISTLFSFFEYNLPKLFPHTFWNENKIFFAFIFQALSFFLLAKSLPLKISKPTSLLMRQLSSFIYFSHSIILYNIMNPILDRFISLPTYAPIMILPKTIVVFLICSSLFFLIKKINNKYLNYLLNG